MANQEEKIKDFVNNNFFKMTNYRKNSGNGIITITIQIDPNAKPNHRMDKDNTTNVKKWIMNNKFTVKNFRTIAKNNTIKTALIIEPFTGAVPAQDQSFEDYDPDFKEF